MMETLFLHETTQIASDKKTCLLFQRVKKPHRAMDADGPFSSYLVPLYLLPSTPITIKLKL